MNFIEIGKIINIHGLNGELKIFPMTDNTKRFDDINYVYIKQKNKHEKYNIEKVRYHKGIILLKLYGINDINEAELYKDKTIEIDRKDAVKLPENAYFISDLINIEIYDDEKGFLGIIDDIIQTGSNDVYIVKKKGEKDILVPALKSVVKKSFNWRR